MANGWTLDTLKEHLESRIVSTEKSVTIAMAAADKAVTKAEVATEKRFDSVNEFRNAMKDQQNTFANRTETEFRLNAIDHAIEKIGGVSLGVAISAAVVAGLISAIGSVVLIETALRHG
jgi:hypothetical protein